jgi:hypothetical protein
MAQPLLNWQRTYGGSADEEILAAEQTPDGGYILVGYTNSDGGQVTGQQGNSDVWVVKTDGLGILQWQRSLGASATERGHAVANTSDGGSIIAASVEDLGGDIASIFGEGDIWLVKLSGNGSLQWESTYGGTSFDEPSAVVETSDGYVVAGYTESDDAMVSGYHGNGDLWVFKTNTSGALQWQNALGGTDTDEAMGMRRTSDNGVIIAGSSKSDNGNLTQNLGGTDAWLVKLSSTGTLQWQRTYGHSGDEYAADVVQRSDDGYTFVAASNSEGGQVSQNFGNYDYWLVRTDANGVLQGEASFGGSSDDIPFALQATPDGGYALAGYSASDNVLVTAPLGGLDFWVVKTNNTGTLQWQLSLGGSDDDIAHAIVATSDAGYLIAGLTNSSDNDVTLARGGMDQWAVKLEGMTTGITPAEASAPTFLVAPNPANDRISVQFDALTPSPMLLRILDASGREVMARALGALPLGSQRIELAIGHLKAGAYAIALHQGNMASTQSIIVLE